MRARSFGRGVIVIGLAVEPLSGAPFSLLAREPLHCSSRSLGPDHNG